jgi:hypothetical protein
MVVFRNGGAMDVGGRSWGCTTVAVHGAPQVGTQHLHSVWREDKRIKAGVGVTVVFTIEGCILVR